MKESTRYLRCKNCEGEMDVREAKNGVLTCPYCRTIVVLPRNDSSDKTKAYLNSGNQNLELGRFDEAYIMFGKAVEENAQEPEGYFGMALSKAKIQYLKDLVNNKLQPICFEITENKFTDDKNYQKALELSNPDQKEIYEEKGCAIDNIKSKFFQLKRNNVEYDTFICCKVTNENGGNTQDSMNALKIYHELKDAGYKPFYSEEILRNFVGEDYEANILYALYSSGSMLMVCSDEEYLQTKWVKNEYTRFITLLEQKEKQRGSIAFVYNGKPIEEFPGIQGKVQGIDFSKFNALNQIISFVEKFAGSNRFLDFQRKEYGKNNVQKKKTIKREIQKRNLSVSVSEAVSISDEAKLRNAQKLLEKGDFENVCNFCNEILMSNKFYGKAYWTLFLAQNKCRSNEEFIKSTTPVANFSDFEKAISATSDKSEREKYYQCLKNRILESGEKGDFDEFVALPEVEEKDLAEAIDKVYETAKEHVDKDLFEAAISVEKHTNRYVRMNLGFLKQLPIEQRKPYYENILNVDAANPEALYENFNIDNNLLSDEAIFEFYSDKKNHETIENTLFAYGFNKFASDDLNRIVQNGSDTKKGCSIYDLILSMVPKGKNKIFAYYLSQAISFLFAGERKKGQFYVDFEQLEKYNNALISVDQYNCNCYVNRMLIDNKIKNPLELMDCRSLYDFADFRLAVNTFAERYPNKTNEYMQYDDELKEIKQILATPKIKQYVLDNYVPKMEWLSGKARTDIIEMLDGKMQKSVGSILQKNECKELKELCSLQKDVTKDEDFVMARDIANVLSSQKLPSKTPTETVSSQAAAQAEEEPAPKESESPDEGQTKDKQEVLEQKESDREINEVTQNNEEQKEEEKEEIRLVDELNSLSERQPQAAKTNYETRRKEERQRMRKLTIKTILWTLYGVGLFFAIGTLLLFILLK